VYDGSDVIGRFPLISSETNFTFLEQDWNIRKIDPAKIKEAAA
jgi:hypothetical protein